MKLILFFIFIFTLSLDAFRLSRVLGPDGDEVLSTAHIKWDKKTITIGTATADTTYPASSSNCDNIGPTKPLVDDIIKIINNIPDAEIKLIWGGTSGEHDITIYSYTSAEWLSYQDAWGVSSSTLGFASSSGLCENNYVCNFTTTVIRLKCSALSNPVTENTNDYKSVLLHEMIHNLGLDHSSDPKALMYPSSRANTTHQNLSKNDESGIVFLYPKSSAPNFLKAFVCGRVDFPIDSPLTQGIKHFAFLLSLLLLVLLLKRNSLKKNHEKY